MVKNMRVYQKYIVWLANSMAQSCWGWFPELLNV